jgi:glycosyltransferase involved in cell wall biosynthesis
MDHGGLNRDGSVRRFAGDNPFPINLIHVNADEISRFREERGPEYFAERLNIGFWAWELASFPEEWRGSFDVLDEVWVPSCFTLDAVSRVSPIPVIRMPHAVTPPARPTRPVRTRDRLGIPPRSCVFFFMFDFHSVMARKNPLGLVEAFRKAFAPDDDAFLLLKSAHSETCPEEREMLGRALEGLRARWLEEVLPPEEIGELLQLCDCYVSLHRSEGFGLTLAEAMAIAKPVIATAYSGNMDFMTPTNSFFVGYRELELERDYGPYRRGAVWAEPDLDGAARWMRHVYRERDHAGQVGRLAAEDVARELSPEVVGGLFATRLARSLRGRT